MQNVMMSVSAYHVHVFPVHGLMLRPFADTYEVRNAAQGPHKGSKFVSTETGATGVGRLRRRHRVQTMTHALKFLGLQNNNVQTRAPGRLWHSDLSTVPNVLAVCLCVD